MLKCALIGVCAVIRLNTVNIFLIVLGFNNTSTLVGHFVSSPRDREKRHRRDSRGDKREGQGITRNRNENEQNTRNKNIPPLPLPTTRIAGLTQM